MKLWPRVEQGSGGFIVDFLQNFQDMNNPEHIRSHPRTWRACGDRVLHQNKAGGVVPSDGLCWCKQSQAGFEPPRVDLRDWSGWVGQFSPGQQPAWLRERTLQGPRKQPRACSQSAPPLACPPPPNVSKHESALRTWSLSNLLSDEENRKKRPLLKMWFFPFLILKTVISHKN